MKNKLLFDKLFDSYWVDLKIFNQIYHDDSSSEQRHKEAVRKHWEATFREFNKNIDKIKSNGE